MKITLVLWTCGPFVIEAQLTCGAVEVMLADAKENIRKMQGPDCIKLNLYNQT